MLENINNTTASHLVNETCQQLRGQVLWARNKLKKMNPILQSGQGLRAGVQSSNRPSKEKPFSLTIVSSD